MSPIRFERGVITGIDWKPGDWKASDARIARELEDLESRVEKSESESEGYRPLNVVAIPLHTERGDERGAVLIVPMYKEPGKKPVTSREK